MKEERGFRGIWIPAEIWLDERLSPIEKVILMEIDSLDSDEKNGCWATNSYLASFCLCSERKVSEAISKLLEIGYICQESFNGRSRILRSCIAKSARQGSKICEADKKNLRGGTEIHYKKNSVYDKHSEYRADKPPSEKRFVPPSIQEVEAYCSERSNGVDPQRFVDYYTANGWRVGKNSMKDWKAAVRTWERNSIGERKVPKKQPQEKKSHSFSELIEMGVFDDDG